jgi:transposase
MYAVERQARRKGLTGDDLRTLRQGVTGPVVREFRRWLQRVEPTLLPSDPLGKAVRSYFRHFEGLTRFVDDPDLPIDDNRSERAFQRHAKLRFHALFAGSPEGAHRWATILGVVPTAQRHGLDVLAYLTWALDRRGTWKRRYGLAASDLTPGAYKQMLEQREECAAAG